jgi:RpiR family transcriptional regulator, carbohydrate utilization regulator
MEKDLLTPFSDRMSVVRGDSIAIVKQKLIKQNQEIIEDTISTLSEAEIEKATKAISKSHRFCIFAEGGSSAAAVAARNMFLQLGLSCEVYQDAFLGISVASQLGKEDVAMAISYSGSSINTVNFLKESKMKHATTIAITGYVNSHLTNSADIVLYTSTKVKNDLRDMHIARISEMCVIGMLQVGIYINSPDLSANIQNLMDATHMTRLKTGQNIFF